MMLREFTRLFPDSIIISISVLSDNRTGALYKGPISNYAKTLNITYEDSGYEQFDVASCDISDNILNILIEDV